MWNNKLIGISITSLALVACGGGGGDGIAAPASFEPPAFLPTNVEVDALSATAAGGVSPSTVTITAGSDGSLTFKLPGGDSLTITDADIDGLLSWPDGTPNIVTYTTDQLDFVDVIVAQDILGDHTYMLTRIDRFNTTIGFETAAVTGEYTTTLPTGSASYEGVVIGSRFINGAVQSLADDYIFGTSSIVANFGGTPSVDITFGNFEDLDGVEIDGTITGTTVPITGVQYTGPIGGSFGGAIVDGALYGGLFGPGAEATAGVFDVANGDDSVAFIGGFDGDKVSSTP